MKPEEVGEVHICNLLFSQSFNEPRRSTLTRQVEDSEHIEPRDWENLSLTFSH